MAPANIGISALEIYFPSQCVEQSELEKFDGVSTGKYTIGLGQTRMSFCDDTEDIYSMTLTTLSSLLKKYNIDPSSIGRLEVGTETLLDKSKSVKTVLMQLFEKSGNTNIEGVDTVNACYGGTNALFNAINWMESSSWDGRNAIVVMGDIALYAKGNARPTGGAGCVAMLITPEAPLVFDAGMRGSYFKHAYDFYKADLTSEYPIVDGQFSIKCYTEAVDACYKNYHARKNKVLNGHAKTDSSTLPLDDFNFVIFHAPTCKLVSKSYARMLYNDYLSNPSAPEFESVPSEVKDLSYEASISDKTVEKTFMGLSKKRFAERVQAGITVPTNCGNMYCASVYGSLCSLLSFVEPSQLAGKKVGVFSYGSGLASTFFSLTVKGDVSEIVKNLDVKNRLENRRVVAPEVYDEMCALRKEAHLKNNYKPKGNTDTLFPGTYYLTEVDDMFRRSYAVKA